MSDEKIISERDAVLLERLAFARGRCASQHEMHLDDERDTPCEPCRRRAKEVYPLPKVVRPRVVRDSSDVQWRAIDGKLQWSYGNEWRPASDDHGQRMFLTDERIPLLAGLLKEPTETVDAD